ncbi:MAG: ADP-ribosylation factor-like protein [Promethearchaeia archaeon]
MVKGLVHLGWDNKIGAVIEFQHPKTLEISEDMTNRIYMAHTAQDSKSEEDYLTELDVNDKVILSYCDKSRVSEVGYEILFIILDEREKVNLFGLKNKILQFSQELFALPESERKGYIEDNLDTFFPKKQERKILFLGRAGIGKTSIKKLIFEGKNPKELIYNPLSPTRGLSPSVHSWLDLDLGVFDSSGQEFDNLLESTTDKRFAFQNASAVIYILDYPSWIGQKNQLLEDIERISQIMENNEYDSKLIIFFHKIDLINNYKKFRNQKITEITDKIQNIANVPIYFTSIYPKYLYSLYNAFCEILGMISKQHEYLKNLLDEKIKDYSKTMAFITNPDHSIVAQSISKDFDVSLVNHIQKLTAQLNQSFADMVKQDNINYLLMSSYKNLTVIMKHLNLPEYNIAKIICVSKTLKNKKLVQLAHQFGINLGKLEIEY